MSKKVLLIGCGQLGSRHLQAIASLPDIGEIHVVDPSSQSLELGKLRLKEISDRNQKILLKWFHHFDRQSSDGDLCIVATQARGRVAIIKEAAQKLGYRKFLIEKIVSQSVNEYKDLLQFSVENNLKIWVDCQTRAHPIHRYIKDFLKNSKSLFLGSFGGNIGLACNGIHYADLFLFYDESKQIKKCGERIDGLLHATKRGSDIFDLSGTILGSTEKGSDLVIAYAKTPGPDQLSIVTERCRFIVDHVQQIAYESHADSHWKWRLIPIEDLMVSRMSKKLTRDILNQHTCDLPTLAECFPAHEFILNSLQPHFCRLQQIQSDFCPVT